MHSISWRVTLTRRTAFAILFFSRIDLDGNVISAFNERIKSSKVCKEIKLRHGLTFGNPTGEKVNSDKLRSIQQLRLDIKSAAIAAANSSTSWTEFQYALEAHGIEACFSINRSTGEIRGFPSIKWLSVRRFQIVQNRNSHTVNLPQSSESCPMWGERFVHSLSRPSV